MTTTVLVTWGVAEAGGRCDAEAEADAEADADADADGRAVAVAVPCEVLALALALAVAVDEPAPSGAVMRVVAGATVWLVCGVGVKTGDEEPRVQAETVTASSIAPAAERPAISHAPLAATGEVRRIFMNAPRMRVR
ncbi:MAG TPA: hypothetical protein VHV09_10620 [Trebonia sp.]|nr:hypothetical protein [Trebonia sp.]